MKLGIDNQTRGTYRSDMTDEGEAYTPNEEESDPPMWDETAESDCTWCFGDGWEECGDPIQCTRRHHLGDHPCSACAGSGLRSKQTVF